jgi:hypothetical protein
MDNLESISGVRNLLMPLFFCALFPLRIYIVMLLKHYILTII